MPSQWLLSDVLITINGTPSAIEPKASGAASLGFHHSLYKYGGDSGRLNWATRNFNSKPLPSTHTYTHSKAHRFNPIGAELVQFCDNHVGAKNPLRGHGSKQSTPALRYFTRTVVFHSLSLGTPGRIDSEPWRLAIMTNAFGQGTTFRDMGQDKESELCELSRSCIYIYIYICLFIIKLTL